MVQEARESMFMKWNKDTTEILCFVDNDEAKTGSGGGYRRKGNFRVGTNPIFTEVFRTGI